MRVCTDVLRRHIVVTGINLPVRIVEIQRHIRTQQIHVGFPQTVQCTNVLPVAFKFIGEQTLIIGQHCRNNVFSEVLGSGVCHFVFDQVLLQLAPGEDIDTHGSQR